MNQILNFLLVVADTSKIPEYEKVVNTKVPSFIGMTFRSIIALCLVIGAMFVFVWVLRKMKKGSGGFNNSGFVKVLGRSYLNSKQSIYLVEIQDRILVLGVSGDSINVLSEIKDSGTVDSIRKSVNNKPFAGHLQSKLSGFISKAKRPDVRKTGMLEGSGLWY